MLHDGCTGTARGLEDKQLPISLVSMGPANAVIVGGELDSTVPCSEPAPSPAGDPWREIGAGPKALVSSPARLSKIEGGIEGLLPISLLLSMILFPIMIWILFFWLKLQIVRY